MTIGRIAKRAGVNVETIRYYQRRGLVAEPERLFDSYRRYPPETVDRILFIKRAQALGFSLDETAGLLGIDSKVARAPIRRLATQKVESLRKQIEDLGARLGQLEQLVDRCTSVVCTGAACPLIGHLSGGCPQDAHAAAKSPAVPQTCAEQGA